VPLETAEIGITSEAHVAF